MRPRGGSRRNDAGDSSPDAHAGSGRKAERAPRPSSASSSRRVSGWWPAGAAEATRRMVDPCVVWTTYAYRCDSRRARAESRVGCSFRRASRSFRRASRSMPRMRSVMSAAAGDACTAPGIRRRSSGGTTTPRKPPCRGTGRVAAGGAPGGAPIASIGRGVRQRPPDAPSTRVRPADPGAAFDRKDPAPGGGDGTKRRPECGEEERLCIRTGDGLERDRATTS